MSTELWTIILVVLTFGVYTYIGYASRVRDTKGFYVAGQMRGVGIVFSRYLQVDTNLGVIIGMAVVAFFAILGGMKGITWTQVAQYSVLIIAYLIPAIAISAKLTGNPVPQLALTFTDIAQRLSLLQVDLGMTEYIKPFQSLSAMNVFAITLALMVGTAGLPHVIIRLPQKRNYY